MSPLRINEDRGLVLYFCQLFVLFLFLLIFWHIPFVVERNRASKINQGLPLTCPNCFHTSFYSFSRLEMPPLSMSIFVLPLLTSYIAVLRAFLFPISSRARDCPALLLLDGAEIRTIFSICPIVLVGAPMGRPVFENKIKK